MNVLFLTISAMPHLSKHSISVDLIHEFIRNGHKVYVVCSLDRGNFQNTDLVEEAGATVLRVKIGKNKKANIIEKGITTLMLPWLYKAAVKKHLKDVKFDLVMYPTPPVTHVGTVSYIKKRDNAKTYLLLKDIFPQNAIDIGMMKKSGWRYIAYLYFRMVEKRLYKVSDYIGCMSQANVDYIIKHNPKINPDKVEVCPNSIEIQDFQVTDDECKEIREKYGIPLDKKVFIYGGNLGKPQGIPFLMECLNAEKNNQNAFFLVVGDGTEYKKLESFFSETNLSNAKLLKKLPKEDYDRLVSACDVGLIFLDHRFTIPNFPSRILAYMQKKMPVLACTDPNTDMGKIITENSFGWWCESNDVNKFTETVELALNADLKAMGEKGFEYLEENYTVEKAYEVICNKVL